jgi:hypothetical protein
MGLVNAEFILECVSASLVEYVVRTTLNPTNISAGTQAVTPGSMRGIYGGVQLVIAGSNTEVITVISTTASTFTATFADSHLSTDTVTGATFSSGQPNTPLWNQAEMLSYLALAQNDFLLAVRPVYAVTPQNISTGVSIYPAPTNAIRIERISQDGSELYNVSQTDIDWQGGYNSRDITQPQYWYQDKVGPLNFGIDPIPQVDDTLRVFYSQSASTSLGLLTPFVVPDLFWPALKYYVLAKSWSKDGEQRDLTRSAYCEKRFIFWQILAGKFVSGLDARLIGKEETVEPVLEMAQRGNR